VATRSPRSGVPHSPQKFPDMGALIPHCGQNLIRLPPAISAVATRDGAIDWGALPRLETIGIAG
jgi:hypothetical protein